MSCTRLGLGTAQWGMSYGVANRAGCPQSDEVREMLALGRDRGVHLLDTAYAYGDAQKVLGAHDATGYGYRIVTKTAPLLVRRIRDEELERVGAAFQESLSLLGVDSVYGLLVHGADALCVPGSQRLWSVLERLKSQGRVRKIGVSVYHPDQLERVLDDYSIDLVQIPFNVYDQRFESQGLLGRLTDMGVEVHARSIFLQGLLLLKPDQLPRSFESLRAHHSSLHEWIREAGLTPLECCLTFGLQQGTIGSVVVGCETVGQLRDVLDAAARRVEPELSGLTEFGLQDRSIVDPSTWRN